jgi:hypothetical protein
MKQLTLRGLDERLRARLEQLARNEGISLNKAALRLLRKGAGLDRPGTAGDSLGAALDEFVGSWSAEQERVLADAVAVFEQVDEGLWS